MIRLERTLFKKQRWNPFWLALGAGLAGGGAAWLVRRQTGIVFPGFFNDLLLGPVAVFFLTGLAASALIWFWTIVVRRSPGIQPFSRSSGCVSSMIFFILSALFAVFVSATMDLQQLSQPEPTSTAVPAAAIPPTATATRPRAESTPTLRPTSTPQRESLSFRTRLRQLVALGYIANTEGEYFKFQNFDESLAQIDRYKTYRLAEAVANFIIRAEARWESASDMPNAQNSGCGFAFHEQEDGHYVAFLAMDGTARLMRVQNKQMVGNWHQFYRKLELPADAAELLLVVKDNRMIFLADGKMLLDVIDDKIPSGALGLSVHSGTNKGFGTRCVMENVEMVELP